MIISPDLLRVTSNGKYDPSPEASALAWQTCFGVLDTALVSSSALVLLVGIPGSGKTTWVEKNELHNVVYFDATFSKRIEREPLIEMAQRQCVPVDAVVFLTPISTCIARNWDRPPDRRVPYPVIASMLENLRREPVSLDEGFVRITAVRP